MLTRSVALLASIALGLGVAEVGAGWARGFAWPYLNVFVADPAFGVRLLPGATTRTRTRLGHVTEIAIDGRGFRGPAATPDPESWAEKEAPRVVVLGDSQAFGYGVAHEATFGVALAGLSGAEVQVLAVPTWGPPESVRALQAYGADLQPEVVVFVVNAANDWIEARVDNARRTTARDGWAVRVTGHEVDTRWELPGRDALLGRSHLVFLVRQALALTTGEPPLSAHMTSMVATSPQRFRPARASAHRSLLTPSILAVREQCRALGCAVVVALLPVDVMVDAAEWAKYRQPSRELAGLHALLDELQLELRAAAAIDVVDLRPALIGASPGAFLRDDPHLSPRGHQAVAAALAPVVRAHLPQRLAHQGGTHDRH